MIRDFVCKIHKRVGFRRSRQSPKLWWPINITPHILESLSCSQSRKESSFSIFKTHVSHFLSLSSMVRGCVHNRVHGKSPSKILARKQNHFSHVLRFEAIHPLIPPRAFHLSMTSKTLPRLKSLSCRGLPVFHWLCWILSPSPSIGFRGKAVEAPGLPVRPRVSTPPNRLQSSFVSAHFLVPHRR